MSSHLTFGKAVWRAVNTYIEQIGSAESRNEFLSSMLSALQGLVPFDVEGGFFQAAGPACRVLGASAYSAEKCHLFRNRKPLSHSANPVIQTMSWWLYSVNSALLL